MSITVRDVTKLKNLQSFRLLAGQKGLNRVVKLANILDYEFIDNNKPFNAGAFDKDSFVISSLFFAKGNGDLILPAMQGLLDAGVAGFAFKTVIYDSLPQEVLDFADENSFPIYSFNRGFEFENIIFDIMDAVKHEDNLRIIEKNIEKMIENKLTRSEVTILAKGISTGFKNQAKAAYITNIRGDKIEAARSSLRRFYTNEFLPGEAALCLFRDDIVVIVTMTEMNQNRFEVILKEVIDCCDLGENIVIGCSRVHSAYEGMDYCLRESYYASIVGKIRGKGSTEYKAIGTYQLLIPNKNSDELVSYMYRYLEPIFDQEELLKTAVQYVLAEGDVNETSERLICHKNTVRYRINKLKEILEHDATDFVFFENLSTAIKIYLLKQL